MSSATQIKEEKNFYVTARDGKDIFVRHAKAVNNDNNKAIILAHGITGRPEEYIHMYARNFFTEKGYDVYCMSFYDDAENTRKMHTTSLPLQANDMNDVVAYVKKKHDKTYLCGHSYGGATILFANPDVRALAFWDSSFDVWDFWNRTKRDTQTIEKKSLATSQRIAMLFSKDMMAHAQSQTPQGMEQLSQEISAPSLVTTASENDMVNQGERLFENLKCEKNYTEIKGADHRFYNSDTATDLYNATHQWFERF